VNQLKLVAHLSRWLEGRGLGAEALTVHVVAEYIETRRAAGYGWQPTRQALVPLVGYLRDLGVVAVEPSKPAVTRTVVDEVAERYRCYLRCERGLAEGTVAQYMAVAHRFLSERPPEAPDLGAITAGDVTGFVGRQCARQSVAFSKKVVNGLRSLLRFLYLDGSTALPLAQAVPAVAGWSLSSLPRSMTAAHVQLLVGGCDRQTTVGRRDYAMLTLLVRLGLRAGEVAALELGDIDWRSGEVVVRGKGKRVERLPLPVDVGDALAAYLGAGRPDTACREVFLRAHAPVGPLAGNAVGQVVRRGCTRAGIAPCGAHRLRHTAATEMLRAGAPLSEVGQVLRHQNAATTAIYAKVDHRALRALAVPWPGAVA
jgi:site-specific recombinase XerD